MSKMLVVSPSPHVHDRLTVPQVMEGVIIAMIPALIFAVLNFGLGAVYVTLLSVLFCVGIEYAMNRYLFNRKTSVLYDRSAILTGILLAFNVPSNLPWHIILIGAIVAIGLGKMSFGGLGNNPFNPALVARVFLLTSFPVEMTSWPVPTPTLALDGNTGATPLGILKEGARVGDTVPQMMAEMPGWMDFFWGFQGGSLGEMSAFAMLLGLSYLMVRRIVTWHIPISMLLTIALLNLGFWLYDPTQYAHPLFHILTGGVMLGAVFMATDYVTSPFTYKGMIIFGVGIGVITVFIRLFGSYPEGVSFAILVMNAFVPMINKYTKPRRYGSKTHYVKPEVVAEEKVAA